MIFSMTNQIESNQNISSKETAVDDSSDHDRSPCSMCGRKFLADRLEKHLQICQKLKEKKRKTFDAAKQRAENLDKINQYPTEISLTPSSENVPLPATKSIAYRTRKKKTNTSTNANDASNTANKSTAKKSNWRAQHEEFVRNIRNARGENVPDPEIQQEGNENGSNKTKSLPPGMVECPSCSRRFSERAAERHLVWCAEKQQKESVKKSSIDQEALERMKARTKYKPPTLTSQQPPSTTSSLSSASTTINRSESRVRRNTVVRQSRSQERAVSNASLNSSISTASTSPSRGNSRKTVKTRAISKSSESLALVNKRGGASRQPVKNNRANESDSRNSMRTDNNGGLHRDNSNRTVVIRRTVNHNKTAQSKIDTGRGSPNKGGGNASGANSPTKMAAPVMKFKEKFPHHQQRHFDSHQFDNEILLRRNSSAYVDDSPKTVPGVRTGGISPVKSSSGNISDGKNSSMSRSETNLQRIGGDIKKRIDMYINGLYSNNEVFHQYSNIFGKHSSSGQQQMVAAPASHQLLQTQLTRQQSANSDISDRHTDGGARGSTSDSTDSGLGVYTQQKQLSSDRNGTEDKMSANGKLFPAADTVSPPMSELEQSARTMMIRNGSLGDIRLMNDRNMESVNINASQHSNGTPTALASSYSAHEENDIAADLTPRFCHSCGTKYPNLLAKFCYECGNRRFAAFA